MLTNLQSKKDQERWYTLPEIKPVHLAYWNSPARFVMGKAGRRSYKTEIAKRIIIERAMLTPGTYFAAAPTIPQVKKIYWKDLVDMSFRSFQKCNPNKSDLIIPFDNGSEIHLLGMEKPKRFEGTYWTGGILDEFAYYKEEAWAESIRPALDTQIPGRPKPWCIIISKPNGMNHFYDRWQYATTSQDTDWEAFEWTAEIVLDADAIAAAKRELSNRQYRQEYLGEFVTHSGRIYDEYGPANYTYETIKDYEQLHYFCDFNFTPMSHGIAVIREDKVTKVQSVYCLDEVILTSAEGHMNVTEFCDKYKDHKNKTIYLYGDRSGKDGEKHSLLSEYILMEKEFKKHGWTPKRRIKEANPGIKDRQNCVNALIKNAAGEVRLYVHPVNAEWTHKGLSTTAYKEGSTFQEEQNKNKYQHITTGLGYMCDYLFPIKYTRKIEDYVMNDIYGISEADY